MLAGMMQPLEENFHAAFPQRALNIHPSLLPAYSGVDTGLLIAQAERACSATDTPASLSARVRPLEHKLFPWVINSVARGDIQLLTGQPTYSPVARERARKSSSAIFEQKNNLS